MDPEMVTGATIIQNEKWTQHPCIGTNSIL